MLTMLRRTVAAIAICSIAVAASKASTIAITEFIIDPFGADDTAPEWIEVFNYGQNSVDLGGWTLKDNASSVYTFPAGFTIPSGGYAIAPRNRQNFINRWLGGVDDPRVAATATPFVLNNSSPGDGIYLRDSASNLIWSVGYQVGGALDATSASQYRATFLSIDDFSENSYGEPPQHGAALINRNGIDGTGTLGYEDNNRTADPHMYASAADAGTTEFGSPLLGHYSVVPEPGAAVMLLGISVGILSRRRQR
jgi:hypothetical protein